MQGGGGLKRRQGSEAATLKWSLLTWSRSLLQQLAQRRERTLCVSAVSTCVAAPHVEERTSDYGMADCVTSIAMRQCINEAPLSASLIFFFCLLNVPDSVKQETCQLVITKLD